MMYRPEQRTPPVVQLLGALIPFQQPDPAIVPQRLSATFSPDYIPRIDPRIVTPLPHWQDVDRYLQSDAPQPVRLPEGAPVPAGDADHPVLPRSIVARALALRLMPARQHSVTGRPLDPGPRRGLDIPPMIMDPVGPRRAGWPVHEQSLLRKMFVTERDGRADAESAGDPQHMRRRDLTNYMPPATLRELRRDILEWQVPYNRVLLRSALRRFVASGDDPEIERKNREILLFLDHMKSSPANLRPGTEDYEIMALRVVCGLAQQQNNLSLCEATLARPRALEALGRSQRGQKTGFFTQENFRRLYADALDRSIAQRLASQAPKPS